MSQIAEMEQYIEEQQELVKRRDLALKLNENRDFRKLILEQFCVQECAKYAQESADPSLRPESRADALALAQAPGHLRRWLSVCVQMGNRAEHEIDDTRKAIEELNQQS